MAQFRLKPTGIVLLLLVLSLISFGLGFGLWSLTGKVNIAPTDSSAGKCSAADNPKDCGGCGPVKGTNRVSYECEWSGGGCRESNNECGGGGGGGDNTGTTACERSGGKNTATEDACSNIGAKVCQGDGSGNTGFQCTCVDMSTGTDCIKRWSCGNYSPNSCKPESNNPIVSTLTIVNGCAQTGSGSANYNVYYCDGMSYEDGKASGCQEGVQSGTGSTICPSKPSGFCGWIQADVVGGGLASWYIPCDEDNPPGEPPSNVCEGGAVTSPVNSADYEVGDVVVFKGYAYDKDGINKNKIAVKVDGVTVGNATATDKSCSGSSDASCVAAAGKPVVEWTYSYTVTTAGAHTFSATWEDTKGVTGASCQGSRVITSNVQGNPDWEITKTGASVCVDKTAGAQKTQVDYIITIKNIGDLAGQLTTLVDTQDEKVKSGFIQENSIVPDADVTGRDITWNVSGALGQFAPGQSKTFKYSMIVPQSSFGTYVNTVKGTPDSGDAIQATEVTIVGCKAPQTALFDSTMSKVILGVILIAGSGIYLYTEGKILPDLHISDKIRRKRREDFEKRVAGR